MQVNALGNPTYFYYDELNRQKGTIDALDNETYFEFDAVGNQVIQVNALGNPTYFYYDELNRQKGTIDALGNETYFKFDALGNQIAQVDALGQATCFYYNEINQRFCTRNPLDALSYFEYDALGKPTLVKDAAGNATWYQYDEVARLESTGNALSQTEYYTYDANSNLTGSQDADGAVIYYEYDELSRQTRVLYPDNSLHYYVYDALSHLAAACDERGRTYFTYDALSRITAERQPGGESVYRSYDKAGRIFRLASAAGCAYYAYDEAGRMVEVEDMGAKGYGIQAYGTTPYGYAEPGFGVTYYAYDQVSQITKKELGNGCYTYFVYDQANRVTQILNCLPDGSPLAYFEYSHDGAGRITGCLRESGDVIYYGYDAASRLTSEEWYDSEMSSIYSFSWDYDDVGNRTYQEWGNKQTYYTYDSGNALIRKDVLGGSSSYFTYDCRGNCTAIQESDGTVYFTFNPANLVNSIKYKDDTLNYFWYDAQLRRYAMEDSDGLRYFTWDGLNLLAEQDAYGTVVAEYTHGASPIEGIGTMVAAKKAVDSSTYYDYPVYDHRGTVVRLTDENADVTAYYSYNAWGVPLREEETSPVGSRWHYSSNWIDLKDSDGELVLSPARLYSAADARFVQRDMLGFVDGLNLYRAFGNNPPKYLDVLGLTRPDQMEMKSPEDIDFGTPHIFPFNLVTRPQSEFLDKVIEKAKLEWITNPRVRKWFDVILNAKALGIDIDINIIINGGYADIGWCHPNGKEIHFSGNFINAVQKLKCDEELWEEWIKAVMLILFHELTRAVLAQLKRNKPQEFKKILINTEIVSEEQAREMYESLGIKGEIVGTHLDVPYSKDPYLKEIIQKSGIGLDIARVSEIWMFGKASDASTDQAEKGEKPHIRDYRTTLPSPTDFPFRE